jgi:hypothetical protein
MLHRYSRDPDPIRAAAGDLMAHLLALKEEPAVQGGEPAARHKRAHAALGLVLEWLMDPRMVAWCPEIRDLELFKPLLDLAQALQDQSDGRQASLLTVKRTEQRASTVEAVYKARCLVLVNAIQLADACGPVEAAREAEKILARKGAKKPIGGYKEPITATTLKQ